jgi:peptidoglycan/xylan/chitin deacetylase (PgdA/CDA1 family)
MRNLLTLALCSTLFLSGCELKEAAATVKKEVLQVSPSEKNQKQTVEQKKDSTPITNSITATTENEEKEEVTFADMEGRMSLKFVPKGTISNKLITYQSTKTTFTTLVAQENVTEINYSIWRTADGPKSMKIFSSTDKENHFPFLFDTKEFSSLRGEYQVEAYGITTEGSRELLANTAVTFQQPVPILMYHAIDDYNGDGLKGLYVTPANFEAQMKYLKDNGYTLLTFERWKDINKVNKPIFVTFDDGMKNNMNAFRILQNLRDDTFQPTATEYVIAGCIDGGPSWLSSNDIREMVNSGIFSVQAHTMSHADLPTITNYEEELKVSKERIEQVTGKPVIALAYPFGHFNDKVVEETKKYYTYATTTKPGQFIETGHENEMMLMQRVRISYDTTLQQFAKLVE